MRADGFAERDAQTIFRRAVLQPPATRVLQRAPEIPGPSSLVEWSGLGACLSSRWHFRSESDSVLLHEQAFPPLEDRPGAASAAERAGLRAEGPSVAFHRGAGPGEPGPG